MHTTPEEEPHGPQEFPAVSVVIPVRDGAATIEAAVRSALAQDYRGPLQVVVADGRSEDGTTTLIQRLAEADPRVRLVENPSRTTPAGLNAAIRAASGEVIVRCDAHSELPAGYVARAVALLAETGAATVGGVQQAVGGGLFQRAVAIAMTSPLGVGDARFHYGGRPGPTDTVYLGAFRRRALDQVGLYDERLERNQDYELNYRIRRAGGMVYFHSDLRVAYTPRGSLSSLARQYFHYGRWKRRVVGLHPGSLRWRQLAAPALLAGLAGSAFLALTPLRPWAALVPIAYLAALTAGAATVGVRRQRPEATLLPLVLATMHLSWGAGFLVGPPRGRTQGSR